MNANKITLYKTTQGGTQPPTNKMNLEAIKEQFDLIVDGARDKITEIQGGLCYE